MYEQQNDAECNSYSDGKVVMNEDEAELCQCCIRIHRQIKKERERVKMQCKEMLRRGIRR